MPLPTPSTSPWTRWDLWAAVIMMGAFTALNFHDAATLPFWYDEGWTLMQITGLLTADGIQIPLGVEMTGEAARSMTEQLGAYSGIGPTLYTQDTHPPAYFQALWAWSHVFGTSLLGMRSFSLLCFTLAVGLLYTEARRHAGPGALVAMAILLASPGAAYSAVNARGYGLALLLIAIAFVGILRAIERPNAKGWPIAVGAAAGLAAITHYFAILALIPMGAYALAALLRKRRWAQLGWMIAAATPGLLFAALVWLPQQMGARPNQMAGFGAWPLETMMAFRVFVNQFTIFSVEPVWVGVLTASITGTLFFAILRQGFAKRQEPIVALSLVGFWGYMVGLVALFWATDKTLLYFSIPRYSVVVLPCLAVLVAMTPSPSLRHSPRFVAAAVALVLVAGLVPRMQPDLFDNPWTSAGSHQAGQEQLANMEPDAIVVLTTREAGRIGTTLHGLPDGARIVYTPTAEDFVAWLEGAPAYSALYMRPLGWGNRPDDTPFPDGFYAAAEAAGYDASGMVWAHRSSAGG